MDPKTVVLVMTLGVAGVTCSSAVAPDRSIALGSWGGQHIAMEVTAEGATIEFDCAHGRISERLTADNDGRFNVAGTYTAEHGGPVRETEGDQSRAVRYIGRVSGKSMSLTISAGGSDSLGSFTLEHGKSGVVRKCL